MIFQKPWLALPAKLAHDVAPYAIEVYSALFGDSQPKRWRSFEFQNLKFPNRIGIAGGVDKNAEHCFAFQKLGCGFVEVGTVTPFPQKPNPGAIIDRNLEHRALWNRMGFPSHGMDEVLYNLKKQKQSVTVPIFVNIGKNRETPNSEAHQDYIACLERLESVASAFVVNISSPNTTGLRDLLKPENLKNFLRPIAQARTRLQSTAQNQQQSKPKPFLLKLSPDLSVDEFKTVLQLASDEGFDGFILTNTTLSRDNGRDGLLPFPSEGGMSGAPLKTLSLKALDIAADFAQRQSSKKLIISAGGIMTPADVFERIERGADLVQVYSALVFEGPSFFKRVAGHFYEQQ